LSRERDKLQEVLSGVVEMSRMPGVIFVVDIKKEAIAVKEGEASRIPVVAIVDTNTDPDPIDHPIPANDDALKSIQLIANAMCNAVLNGTNALRQKKPQRLKRRLLRLLLLRKIRSSRTKEGKRVTWLRLQAI